MSGYELLKFLHIAAVIAWLGGGIGITVLQVRIGTAGDRAALMSIGRQMEQLAPTGKKLLAESQKPEPDGRAIAGYSKRMRSLGMTNLAILMLVVLAMVAKPGV
jgi:uncharacterized membrane protein